MSFFDEIVAKTGVDPSKPTGTWQPGDPGPAPVPEPPGAWDRVQDLLGSTPDTPTGTHQPGDPTPAPTNNESWADKLLNTPPEATPESNFWDNLAGKYGSNTTPSGDSQGLWDKVKERNGDDGTFWDKLLEKDSPQPTPAVTPDSSTPPVTPHTYQPSEDTELDGYLKQYADARNGTEPDLAHTGIGASHMGMTTNLANRLDNIAELTKRINPDSSSLGINAATTQLAATRSDIFTASNDIQSINKALADYHAEINRYWIDMTAARNQAQALADEYRTAAQIAALPPGMIGTGTSNGQEQLSVPGFGLSPFGVVPPELRGVTSRTPEAIQQDLVANMAEQRRVIQHFVGAQPGIQAKMGVAPTREVAPMPVPAPAPGGVGGIGLTPGGSAATLGGPSSSGWSGSSAKPSSSPAVSSSTPSSNRNDNADGLQDLLSDGSAPGAGVGSNGVGAPQQQQAAMPTYYQQPQQQSGNPLAASNTPEVLSDGEFNDLLDSIIKDNQAADSSGGVVGAPTSGGTAGTSLSSAGTPTKAASLVQPPSWMNAQTAGTGESSGAATKPGATGGANAGTSSTRPASGMPMMPMMPPGGAPAGGGRADKSDRPKIQNVDPDIYGDDIKTTAPVIGARAQDRQS